MYTKETWFIILKRKDIIGVGECGILRGLSIDDTPDFESKLKWTCNNIHLGLEELLIELVEFPSIQFGLEMAFLSLKSKTMFELFPSEFTKGQDVININGLIWMGNKAFMKQQIQKKINAGFSCIKLKIGAIDFKTELDLLKAIRTEFKQSDIELRVDANGAFKATEALEKLKQLSAFNLHSIEQPIQPKQWQDMAYLCSVSPLPIALDEELIGVFKTTEKEQLLNTIKPQYIILKPSLIGGFKITKTWIKMAQSQTIGWWITSALESNVGLNAISQFTYTLNATIPQGLGTGTLFTNNFTSPLHVKNGTLHYNKTVNWNFKL